MKKITTVAAAFTVLTSSLLPTSVLAQEGQLNLPEFQDLGDGSEMLEQTPFEHLARDGEMTAYKHEGFWSPMDTMRDKEYLEKLWAENRAPWKIWQ